MHRITRNKWQPARLLSLVVMLVAIGALWTGCSPSHSQSTFDAAGPIAQKQLNLFLIIFWTAVVVFVAVEGALIYAAIKFRRKPGTALPKQVHGNTRLEVAWTIAPALILLVIAVPTIATIFETAKTPDQAEVLQVTVRAHQWWWEFEYPQLGVVTANELHMPPEPWVVEATLESDDVIHSFWIPKLAGKMDVIPNNVRKLWFSASRIDADPTTPELDPYFGLCAEFCGTAHAQMRFKVWVSPTKEAFDAWVERQKAPPSEPTTQLAQAGQELFGTKGCTVCHTISGPDRAGMQKARMTSFLRREPGKLSSFPAPNLTHFASRTTLAAGIRPNTDEDLREWLQNPNEVKPGNRMGELAGAYNDSKLRLTGDNVDALVAFLRSLQ